MVQGLSLEICVFEQSLTVPGTARKSSGSEKIQNNSKSKYFHFKTLRSDGNAKHKDPLMFSNLEADSIPDS